MKRNVTAMLLFSAATFGQTAGQAPRDVAPLKYWPAPLYWQPDPSGKAVRPERAPPAQTPVNSLVFVGMTPCRVADTRSGFGFTGAFGPPSLTGGATRAFPIQASTTCAIPSIAKAYSFNLTVVPPAAMYYLTIWPVGESQPNVSTLNDLTGTVIANAAVVPAGNDSSGSVDVYVSNNTDLIIDINGYYSAQTGITLTQGTPSAPSLSFSGDSETGIYSPGADIVNISSAGSVALSIGGVNTAAGYQALGQNTSGTLDSAFGAEALFSNTTGNQNTGAGYFALFSNTSGGDNTATGYYALGSNNASYNTADGALALHADTSGADNTAIGAEALYTNVTGGNNIAIGAAAGYNISGSYNIDIGHPGISGESNVMRLGGDVDLTYITGIYNPTISGPVPVYISNSGELGTISSSRRYKEDIRDMGDASSALLQLRPVTFRYKQPCSIGVSF